MFSPFLKKHTEKLPHLITMIASYVDYTGQYVASVITRSGRSEVQLFTVDSTSGRVSTPTRVELSPEDTVFDAHWVDHQATHKQSKRNRNDDAVPTTSSGSNLVVLVAAGVLVLTPGLDKVVSRIGTSQPHSYLASSPLQKDTVWAIGDSSIDQIDLSEQSVVKTIKTGGTGSGTGLPSPNSQKNSIPLVVPQGKNVAVIDASKSRRNVTTVDVPGDGDVRRVVLGNTTVYIAKDDGVHVYDLDSQKFGTINTETSTIQVIRGADDEALAVVGTTTSIYKGKKLLATIGADFSNVFSCGEHLIGVWYDANEANFEQIPWNFGDEGDIPMSIGTSSNGIDTSVISNTEKVTGLVTAAQVELENLPVDELVEKLVGFLENEDAAAIAATCASNGDAENIKAAVKRLSHNPAQINLLFAVVSSDVAADPSSLAATATWLKWILLINGGSIGKQADQVRNLKHLEKGLNEGMKLMPHLMALQGRLQLLRSQAALRESVQRNVDSEGVTHTTEQDGLVFANGEDDDEAMEETRIEDDEEEEE